MTNILDTIIAHKKTEIVKLDASALRYAAESAPLPRDVLAALSVSAGPTKNETASREQKVRLIAELKRASPSKGILAPHLDLFQVAKMYTANGAAAISVLTDEKFFLGKLDTLRELRFTYQISAPLLRKDFIIDERQVYETRASGADAILLITAALPDDAHFTALHSLALELGLTPLVEVHTADELARALKLPGLKLVGINNRDLTTFNVSLATTEQLRPLIPAGVAVVAESGIFTAADVARLKAVGVDAVLVGEALITATDIGAKVRELSGLTEKMF